MVVNLVKLRWQLTINEWKRSPVSLIFAILGVLYAASMLIFVGAGLFYTSDSLDIDTTGSLMTLLGATALIGWIVVPIFLTGSSPFLDPRNFLIYGLKPRDLLSGLLLSGVVSPAGILTMLGLMALSLAWRSDVIALIVSILAALLMTFLCLASMHALIAFISRYLASRRIKEILSIVAVIPLMLAGVIIVGALDTVNQLWDSLPAIAEVLLWTPLGLMGAGWKAAEGNMLAALGELVLGFVWIGLAMLIWSISVRNADLDTGAVKRSTKDASVGLLGRASSPTTAVAARSLIHWTKDPRYSTTLIVLPLLFGVAVFLDVGADGAGFWTLATVPFTAFLVAFSISADISYDSTGFALHVLSGIKGTEDRWGRVLALSAWAVPGLLLVLVGAVAFTDRWELFIAMLGLVAGLYLGVTGLSSVASVLWIYPTPQPNASPLSTPEGAFGRILVMQSLMFVSSIVVSIPVGISFILALVTDGMLWDWITLIIGVVLGTIFLVLGVRLGGTRFDQQQSEMFQLTVKHAQAG